MPARLEATGARAHSRRGARAVRHARSRAGGPEAAETPLDRLILQQTYDHYRQALATLKPRDRILIIASLEKDWSVRDITARLPMKSVPATRVALSRALQRLAKQLKASARVDRPAS